MDRCQRLCKSDRSFGCGAICQHNPCEKHEHREAPFGMSKTSCHQNRWHIDEQNLKQQTLEALQRKPHKQRVSGYQGIRAPGYQGIRASGDKIVIISGHQRRRLWASEETADGNRVHQRRPQMASEQTTDGHQSKQQMGIRANNRWASEQTTDGHQSRRQKKGKIRKTTGAHCKLKRNSRQARKSSQKQRHVVKSKEKQRNTEGTSN